MVEWANAALNEQETAFIPAEYSEKKKLSFKAGLIVGAVVAAAAAIAIHFV